MSQRNITAENIEFVLLSFEGPDRYSLAGGLGVRVDNLSVTLAEMGFPTHLFFIGDPELKGEEVRQKGKLILHRWCQWISRYYPNGVYEGEDEKLYDFNESIPWFVKDKVIKPALAQGKLVVILGEEWQTSEAMCRLSDVLHKDGLGDRVVMFWNANNIFSFNRIDWGRLSYTTTITTVSRYMKHIMWKMGLNPLVIPNGIPKRLLRKVDDRITDRVRQAIGADLILCKVARWDPDKRWNTAVEAVARLKDSGLRTVLLARGGMESHGKEVLYNARSLGLTVKEAETKPGLSNGYLTALQEATPADVIDIRFHVPLDFLRFLYRAADGVLANSGHEPFGIVGLEAMAAGGITFTGCTGEDYAVPFVNSFVLETADPMEIVGYMTYLRHHPEECTRIRKAARRTARYFTWEAAVQNLIGRLENQARIRGLLDSNSMPPSPQFTPPDIRLRFHWDSANSDIEQNGTRFDALSCCAQGATEAPPRISPSCHPG
jgi:glycosyltransferase involved in cell wall biosynthesis